MLQVFVQVRLQRKGFVTHFTVVLWGILAVTTGQVEYQVSFLRKCFVAFRFRAGVGTVARVNEHVLGQVWLISETGITCVAPVREIKEMIKECNPFLLTLCSQLYKAFSLVDIVILANHVRRYNCFHWKQL